MKHPLNVVAVSGGMQRPSKSAALAQHLLDLISAEFHCQQRLIEMGDLASQLSGAVLRSQLSVAIEKDLTTVEHADVLVVVTPVYRGSYTGIFKHFFDFIDQNALIDTPVLLAATGGSERHALIIDHQLRPLFSFFQARTAPLGIYVTDKDFTDNQLKDIAAIDRASQVIKRALPLIELSHQVESAFAHTSLMS